MRARAHTLLEVVHDRVSSHTCTTNGWNSRIYGVVDASFRDDRDDDSLDRNAMSIRLIQTIANHGGRSWVFANENDGNRYDRVGGTKIIPMGPTTVPMCNALVMHYTGLVEADWMKRRLEAKYIDGIHCSCPYAVVVVARYPEFCAIQSMIFSARGIDHIVCQTASEANAFMAEKLDSSADSTVLCSVDGGSAASDDNDNDNDNDDDDDDDGVIA